MHIAVGTKLLGSFIVILVLLGLVGGLAIYNLAVVSEHSTQLYTEEFRGLRNVERARTAAEQYRAATILAVYAPDATEREQALARRSAAGDLFNQETTVLQALLYTPANRQLLADAQAAWSRYTQVADAEVSAALAGDRDRAVQLIYTTGQEEREEVERSLHELSEGKNRVAEATAQRAVRTAQNGRNLTLALLLGALLVGTALALWLRQLIQAIAASATHLAGTTNELLAAVTQQEASTTEQAAAVSQTTVSVDEVRATAQQASQKAREVAGMAQEAAEVASQGLATIEESMQGMQDVRGRVAAIAEQILALSEQTQQVGAIIASVEDLADQSNLLAVNAAIEAARAGDQGRGFAVVAQEIRSLAERSKAATVKVRTILTNIQRATNAAVMATEQGTKGATEGAKLVDRSGVVIRQLAAAIDHAAGAAQQILAAAGQQGTGMDQIADAMTNINHATNDTAAATRQLQKVTENVHTVARRLNELVGRADMNGAALMDTNHVERSRPS